MRGDGDGDAAGSAKFWVQLQNKMPTLIPV